VKELVELFLGGGMGEGVGWEGEGVENLGHADVSYAPASFPTGSIMHPTLSPPIRQTLTSSTLKGPSKQCGRVSQAGGPSSIVARLRSKRVFICSLNAAAAAKSLLLLLLLTMVAVKGERVEGLASFSCVGWVGGSGREPGVRRLFSSSALLPLALLAQILK